MCSTYIQHYRFNEKHNERGVCISLGTRSILILLSHNLLISTSILDSELRNLQILARWGQSYVDFGLIWGVRSADNRSRTLHYVVNIKKVVSQNKTSKLSCVWKVHVLWDPTQLEISEESLEVLWSMQFYSGIGMFEISWVYVINVFLRLEYYSLHFKVKVTF
jgi:hypothetical protein